MDSQSSVEELKRLLQEAQQRAEEAEQQREEAEQQRQREQQRAEEAERQRDEERQQTRKTTLAEYIEACHELLFKKFEVETDKSLTSKGPMTNPQNKWCPTRLSAWSDFLEQQKTLFGRLFSVYPDQSRDFETIGFLRGLGERVVKRKLANEKDLEYLQHNIVEDPVRLIVDCLAGEDEANDEFDIGNGIVFDNHPNAISDAADGPTQRRAAQQLAPMTPVRHGPDHGPDLNQLRPDQICLYKYDEDGRTHRTMAFIVEYKPPHKLRQEHLRLGLRPMDIYKDVVNRATKPTVEDPELFQYHSDRGRAGVQLPHDGRGDCFPQDDWTDPTTLYYHLAEPAAEVEAHPHNFRYCTAVSQVLAFTLLALGSRVHGQGERRSATRSLKTWQEDYDAILREIQSDQKQSPRTPPSSAFEPKTYSDVDRSPYPLRGRKLLRRRKKKTTGTSRTGASRPGKNPSPEQSDDESEARMPDTPVRPRNRGGLARQPRGDSRQGSSSRGGGGGSGRNRQYCTQKCLLGLIGGGRLDEECPNVSLHIRGQDGDPRYHPVDHTAWLRLLREQLTRTLDDGIVPLGKQGARGALFQVTLIGYGYTFVCKGTVPEFVEDLEHEAAVYQRLQPLQGVCVPVFLGAVDLVGLGQISYYDFRVRIVHMMFLSWAGEGIGEGRNSEGGHRRLGRELMRSVRALHRMGVAHTDLREPNALWSGETGRVMLIDFERAVLADPPRLSLAPVVPNKRARPVQYVVIGKTMSQLGLKKSPNLRSMMQDDILAAKTIL